jgi:prepilin-type N-terminal cleavage/methylation domain-containing protein
MRRRNAFTLVEILIVVVILGVLAGVVVPQFSSATQEASELAALDQLTKVRNAVSVYYVRNHSQLPTVQEGDGTWGTLLGPDYLREPPKNFWVKSINRERIIFGDAPDTLYHGDYGWIYNDQTGELWAACFDENDRPIQP